ncbi:MAG: Asp-tRNA(Asn)/Glu-tRNA(Gln) amidotransferase subunit GatC [Cellulosilyticum sp.]|nr:Asp-tRNA(Asn)/Glu-tRNA(Gln) amidotransferase subunit GatC [Cellulosilyticum sp.]
MLDTELITYLANLSKIEIEEAEKENLVSEMSAIVDLMDAINEISIEDDINLNGKGVDLESLREDQIIESYNRALLLTNASHKKDGFFVVPKIME